VIDIASRYWVGGSGNWSDTAHWSETSGGSGGASVPTNTDDAIVDANSGSAAFTITLNVDVSIRSFSCSNSNCTLSAGSRTITMNNGNWNWSAGTFNYGTSTFVVASGTCVWTYSGGMGREFWNVTVNEGANLNVQGTWNNCIIVRNITTINGTLSGQFLWIDKYNDSAGKIIFGPNCVLSNTSIRLENFSSTAMDVNITKILPYSLETHTNQTTFYGTPSHIFKNNLVISSNTSTLWNLALSGSIVLTIDFNNFKFYQKYYTSECHVVYDERQSDAQIEIYGYGGFVQTNSRIDVNTPHRGRRCSYGAQLLDCRKINNRVVLYNRGYNSYWRVREKFQNPPLNQPLNQCFSLLTNSAYGCKLKPGVY